MAKFLYPEFLILLKQYAAVRVHWRARFERLVPEAEQPQWKISSPDNELHCFDGEATDVFTALNRQKRRGLSVVQAKPSKKPLKISARTDTFGASYYAKPIMILHIWCELTDETDKLAEQLIYHWLTPGMTVKKMDELIVSLVD